MKVTIPQLIECGIIVKDDGDEDFTAYAVNEFYCIRSGTMDVAVIQHLHDEIEEKILLIDGDYHDDPYSILVTTDLEHTEFEIRLYEEIFKLPRGCC